MKLTTYQTTAVFQTVLKHAVEIGNCPIKDLPSVLYDLLAAAHEEHDVNLVGDTETYDDVYEYALTEIFKAQVVRKWHEHASLIV
jgi:hypothetical protein